MAGRARRARFDPASGMSRLVTERVTRAEAEQRRGRGGRVAEGTCYRYWTKGEEGGLAPYPLPEIAAADLTGLALELALWGSDGAGACLPDAAALPRLWPRRGRLLEGLGALDAAGRITAHGRVLAGLPLHPRLGHMLAVAGPEAATLAALHGGARSRAGGGGGPWFADAGGARSERIRGRPCRTGRPGRGRAHPVGGETSGAAGTRGAGKLQPGRDGRTCLP